jgi:hypothetical protein
MQRRLCMICNHLFKIHVQGNEQKHTGVFLRQSKKGWGFPESRLLGLIRLYNLNKYPLTKVIKCIIFHN